MEKSLTLRYNLSALGISVLGLAFSLAFNLSPPGPALWVPVSVMLLAGLSAGSQDARAMLKAKDELLDALFWKDVNTILRKHAENRVLYTCVRVVSLGAFIAAIMYVDESVRAGCASFFAFFSAYRAIQLPSILKLDRYARNRVARAAA